MTRLEPSKRIYDMPPQPTTEAGIHAAWRGDLYVVLGDAQTGGGYAVRIYFNPLVRCIWIGALVMFFGGAVSLSDRRLRVGAPGARAGCPRRHPPNDGKRSRWLAAALSLALIAAVALAGTAAVALEPDEIFGDPATGGLHAQHLGRPALPYLGDLRLLVPHRLNAGYSDGDYR